MKILIALFCIGILSVIVSVPSVSACSCAAEWDIQDDFVQEESIIFSGKVSSIKEQQRTFLVTFEVDQSWKGIPENISSINTMTFQSSATCGYNFVDGQSYLVVAHGKWDQTPEVSSCSSTTDLAFAHEQISFLNKQLQSESEKKPLKPVSENFYTFDSKINDFSNISNLDYDTIKKDAITASISNGEITKLEFDMKTFVKVQVKMQDDGFLYVNIPKKIMYLADHTCNSNGFLLLDGEEVLNEAELQDESVFDKNIKSWGLIVPKDSKEIEIAFAFIIPDAPYSYAFGQRCLMLENGEFMKPQIQKNLGLELYQITCKDGLEFTFKKESRPACVKADTFIKLFERGWHTRLFLPQFITLHEDLEIGYNVVGDAKIIDVVNNPKSRITEISIDAKSKSNLIIALERDFVGIPYNENSIGYSVFVDGKKSDFEEPWDKNEYRIDFQLNIPQNAKKITINPS